MFYKILCCVLIVIGFYVLNPVPYDDTDDPITNTRSGLRLYVDNLTGCEYLGTLLGSLTPRLDGDGEHLGCYSINELFNEDYLLEESLDSPVSTDYI